MIMANHLVINLIAGLTKVLKYVLVNKTKQDGVSYQKMVYLIKIDISSVK